MQGFVRLISEELDDLLDSTFPLNQSLPQVVAQKLPLTGFIAKPTLPQCEISVAIPVRNEADQLDSTLRAVTAQVDCAGNRFDPRRFEILILANNCADESAAVVRQWQLKPSLPPIHLAEIELPPAQANCGRARQIVMDAAFTRLKKLKKSRAVIASTDGDTRVASDWIAMTLSEIHRGADAVSGRIMIRPNELANMDVNTRRYHLRDVYYRHLVAELEGYLAPVPSDPHPRHHQHFNASFAVTVETYQRAGGVPSVTHLEDFAFYQSLLRIDARFRHSPQVKVFTSARAHGRTSCGLSTQLAEWAEMGNRCESYFVEGLNELEARFICFQKLRQLWQCASTGNLIDFNQVTTLSEVLCVKDSWLMLETSSSKTFGSLRQAVERKQREIGIWRVRYALVPVEEAIASFRLRLEKLRHSA
ncbi:MAG: glycosyltransferase family A protein [Pyrinomonadaceae bacterium]